jgi:hypothetical protein
MKAALLAPDGFIGARLRRFGVFRLMLSQSCNRLCIGMALLRVGLLEHSQMQLFHELYLSASGSVEGYDAGAGTVPRRL